eukprot:2749846-Amphidinium_carterae.1
MELNDRRFDDRDPSAETVRNSQYPSQGTNWGPLSWQFCSEKHKEPHRTTHSLKGKTQHS